LIETEEPRPTRVRVRVRRRKRRRSRKPLFITLGILAGVAVFGALTLLTARGVQNQLLAARTEMEQGREALLAGDAGAARAAFERASSEFIRARGSYRNPLLMVTGYLPIVGRSVDSVGAIIDAGTMTAEAATELTRAVESLRGGAAALAPQAGTIPLEPLESVAPALADAEGLLDRAALRMHGASDTFLLPAVSRARDELEAELTQARRGVAAAEALSRSLPSFLGASQPRRYFVAAQNPAEMRGTGGFIGVYAILAVEEGRLELGSFEPITTLKSPPGQVDAPNPDYAARYDQYGGAGFWQNINMTPDFPSAASAIETLYERSTGTQVDGVIAADPFALAELVEVTGPVAIPGTGTQVDADGLVSYVTNEAYRVLTNPAQRKRVLGDVAEGVLREFLRGSADPGAMGQALVEAASGGHLLLHSRDPQVQAAFVEAGIAGELPTGGDLLGVIWNNASGNKIDFYAEQEISYTIRLGAEGSGVAETHLSYTNEAPDEGEPQYIIGPYSSDYEAGENVALLSTYCAKTCELDHVRMDGVRVETARESELGHPAFPATVRLQSGETSLLDYGWRVREAWHGDDGAGIYRLTVRTQPTIRPTRLAIDIQAPEGMAITGTSPEMRVMEGRAVWQGEASAEMVFELRFQRPTLARAWNAVLDFLGKPLIRF
jgi:Protein of unknown function (DUF4012)